MIPEPQAPSSDAMEACPGCGLVLPVVEGPTHAYIGASASCWARFGEVLAREFQDQAYFSVHQMTVDAYAASHPGTESRRSVQSVAMHLMTLCLVLERGADPAEGPALHRMMIRRPAFSWLAPPETPAPVTVADVLEARDLGEHRTAVHRWASAVWASWHEHHTTVRGWVDSSLSGEPDDD